MSHTPVLRHFQSLARSLCGEFMSASAMAALLSPPAQAHAETKRGRVLLAVEGLQPAPDALRYALAACERAHADLDLLYVGERPGAPIASSPSGVTVRSLHRPGPLDERVAEQAQRCRELLFVITSASLSPHLLLGRGRPRRRVEVPVVVLDAAA